MIVHWQSFTWVVVGESCEEILLPIGLSLQMHLTQTTEHLWTREISVFLAQKKGKAVLWRQSWEARQVVGSLTWVSGWTGVALGPPAAAIVTAALRVGHHHAVPGLAADQALVNLQETHVLVGCSAIWGKRKKKEGEWTRIKGYSGTIRFILFTSLTVV